MLEKLMKNALPTAIVIAAVIIGAVLVYTNKVGINKEEEGILSVQVAAEKTINYINNNLLSGGTTASLVSVSEENGLYKLKIKIAENEFDSYVTKDGKILFPNAGINLDSNPANPAASPTPAIKKTCEDLKKADKPIFEAFIVSGCPYGLQMQRILNEIDTNIPSLIGNIKVRYIGAIQDGKITSMHGDAEAQENLRQICIREEQGSKYWFYVACHIKKGDVDGCIVSANIDKDGLNSCMTDSNKGLKYAKTDFDLQGTYGVSGSPTLFLNGEQVSEFDFGGRTAEASKTLLCCGFTTKPAACSQKLSEDQAATSFSETYASSSGASSSASCGQ